MGFLPDHLIFIGVDSPYSEFSEAGFRPLIYIYIYEILQVGHWVPHRDIGIMRCSPAKFVVLVCLASEAVHCHHQVAAHIVATTHVRVDDHEK